MIIDGNIKSNLDLAADLLRHGEVVAIPTETVYGLAVNAFDTKAAEKIFQIKARPKSDPLILHIHSTQQLSSLVLEVSEIAQQLIQAFWPGPMTLVFKKSSLVEDIFTAQLPTVAIRLPKHPIARQLLEMLEFPLAAPSANKFQSISPTSAAAVEHELGDRVPIIVDGGPCESGIESTVISVVDKPVVLRLGAIPLEDIELVLGHKVEVSVSSKENENQVAPGLLSFHYAPRTPLTLVANIKDLNKDPELLNEAHLLVYSNIEKLKAPLGIPTHVLSPLGSMQEAGRNFFSLLRAIDQQRPARIIAVQLPEQGVGRAINDRLMRAQHT